MPSSWCTYKQSTKNRREYNEKKRGLCCQLAASTLHSSSMQCAKSAQALVTTINSILLTHLTSLSHLHDEVWKLFPPLHQQDKQESEPIGSNGEEKSEKEYQPDDDVNGSGGVPDVGAVGGVSGVSGHLLEPAEFGVSAKGGRCSIWFPHCCPITYFHSPSTHTETPKSSNTVVSGSSTHSPARVHPTPPSKETTSDIVSSTSPHPTEAVKFTPQMTTTSSSG